MQSKKKLGIGSLSLCIFLAAFIFTSLYIPVGSSETVKLGELFARVTHLPLPYDIITIVLLIISYLMGKKHDQDLFAKSGRVLSLILLLMFAAFTVLSFILP